MPRKVCLYPADGYLQRRLGAVLQVSTLLS